MQPLIDSHELSSRIHVPVRTLDQWAYLNKGPAYVRIGRHRRYRPEDVDAWVKSRVRGGGDTVGAVA